MKVSNVYKQIVNCCSRVIVLQGGARSTKTYSVLQSLTNFCHRNAGARAKVTITRNSLPLMRETVMFDFFEILRAEGIYDQTKHNKTNNTYELFGNLVEFQSYKTVQEASGGGRDILYVNECNEQRYEIIEQLRIRTTHKEIYDYNPTNVFWLHEQRFITHEGIPILDGNGKSLTFFKSTYKDNPFLQESQIAIIERLQVTSPKKWKVFGLGELGDFSGKVFTNAVMVDERPSNYVFSGYGVDFGYSQDPTAVIQVWLKHSNGRIEGAYLKEVIYQTGLTGYDTACLMKERNVSRMLPVICDSARPDTIEELRRAGFNAHKSAGKDILAGVDFLQSLELLVDSSSPNLVKEFNNYAWATDRLGKELNKPEDCFNHGIDASRYHIFTCGMKTVAKNLMYGVA